MVGCDSWIYGISWTGWLKERKKKKPWYKHLNKSGNKDNQGARLDKEKKIHILYLPPNKNLCLLQVKAAPVLGQSMENCQGRQLSFAGHRTQTSPSPNALLDASPAHHQVPLLLGHGISQNACVRGLFVGVRCTTLTLTAAPGL